MLKSIVIIPNDRTKEIGDLLAIARAEARKRERMNKNPPVLVLEFIPKLGIYVAVYEVPDTQKPKDARKKEH